MGKDTDPKWRLTRALTERPHEDSRDTFTDLKSPEHFEHQSFIRVLGAEWGYDIPFFWELANMFENMALSIGRKSREEALKGLFSERGIQYYETGVWPEMIEEGKGKKRK